MSRCWLIHVPSKGSLLGLQMPTFSCFVVICCSNPAGNHGSFGGQELWSVGEGMRQGRGGGASAPAMPAANLAPCPPRTCDPTASRHDWAKVAFDRSKGNFLTPHQGRCPARLRKTPGRRTSVGPRFPLSQSHV